ncbi:MAG: hypothetical protein ACE5J7_01350 [Candidatus Aenigmatarchaeota archaeon]
MLQFKRSAETLTIFLEACLVAVLVYGILVTLVAPGITGYLLSGPTMEEVHRLEEIEPGEVPLMTSWILLILMIILLVVIIYMKKFAKKE